MEYAKEQLLRIARRQNNRKRSYLLVNPLQAKHMPVSPTASLEMMHCLGRKLAAGHGKARLLIAFAETATAIGAVSAKVLGPDCLFLPTTREDFSEGKWIDFLEEHSHAMEQRLSADGLAKWLRGTEEVILVDDEFSTGRTLRNMVRKLKEMFPEIREKKITAASLLNRLTEEQEEVWRAEGIRGECLLKYTGEIDEARLCAIETREAETPRAGTSLPGLRRIPLETPLPDPRRGMLIGRYEERCREAVEGILRTLGRELENAGEILVLGTEECMYPALLLGREMEARLPRARVFCHATTRSPIGISEEEGYPIQNGVRLPSFYDGNRVTYLYLLRHYDAAVILTDAAAPEERAVSALQAALAAYGCKNIYFPEAGGNKAHV